MASRISEGEWIALFVMVVFISIVALTIVGKFPWAKIGPGQTYWGIELYLITFLAMLVIIYAAWFVFKRIYKYFK